MSIFSPVLIRSNSQRGPWASTTYGPFAFNNKLYDLQQDFGGTSRMLRSTDGGGTWTELDAAHNFSGTSTGWLDAAGKRMIVAFRVAGAGGQPIHLINFDFVTETWGAIYATVGAPSDCTDLGFVQLRTDNTVFILYDNGSVGATSNAIGAVFSQPSGAGAWVTTFNVGANLRAEAGWIGGTRIHVNQSNGFMQTSGLIDISLSNSGSGLFAHQSVTLANTLSNYHLFTENLSIFSGMPIANAVVFQGKLVIGASIHSGSDFATVYTAPIPAAPVFTPLAVPNGIMSASSVANGFVPDNVPRLAVSPDGTKLYAVYASFGTTAVFQQIHIATCTGDPSVAVNWTENLVWDLLTDAPPGFNVPGQEVQLAALNIADPQQTLLTIDANDPLIIINEQAYWMGVFNPAGPPRIDPSKLPIIQLPDPTKECN